MNRRSLKSVFVILMTVMLIVFSVPVFSAVDYSELDLTQEYPMTLTCDKEGYTFQVYRVATLTGENSNDAYSIKYVADGGVLSASNMNVETLEGLTTEQKTVLADLSVEKRQEIKEKFNTLLSYIDGPVAEGTNYTQLSKMAMEILDGIDEDVVKVFTKTSSDSSWQFTTDESTLAGADLYSWTKNFSAGLYYIRVVNFPASVTKANSSFFPHVYYDARTESWVETSTVPLAEKVASTPVNDKNIINDESPVTNEPQDYTNTYADAGLESVITYQLIGSKVGTQELMIDKYEFKDTMSGGLTLHHDSANKVTDVVVKLLDINNQELEVISPSDYTVKVVSNTSFVEGVKTVFTVALTPEYLHSQPAGTYTHNYYDSDVAFVAVEYKATVNQKAVIGKPGNPNEETLTYGQEGNFETLKSKIVYVYTHTATGNKMDGSNNNVPLAGAVFGIYLTEEDAKNNTNAIGTGTSGEDGKVDFERDGQKVLLESRVYYIREISAPTGYIPNEEPYRLDCTSTYNITLVHDQELDIDTYVNTEPTDGVAKFDALNYLTWEPFTGGTGAIIFYIVGGCILATAIVLVVVKRRKSVVGE